MQQQQEAVPPVSQPVPAWSSLVRVLFAPRATFQALGEHPPFLPPYLVASLFGLVIYLLILRALPQGLAERGITATPPGALLFTQIFMAVITVGGAWLHGAVVAYIAVPVAQGLGRWDARFLSLFGLAGYARMPLVVGAVVSNLASWFKISLPLSFGFLVPKGSSPYLWAIADSLKFFDLWYWALLAVGFATIFKLRLSRAALLPVILYLIGLAWDLFVVFRNGVPGW